MFVNVYLSVSFCESNFHFMCGHGFVTCLCTCV